MEILLNSALVWFAIGFAFFLLEFLLPGFILFFFGIGAWVVALLSLFLDISLNTQIVIFIVSSLITVVLFRNWVRRKFGLTGVNAQQLEDEFIGKTAKAETAIKPGENGKVQFKGTSWDAASDAIISAGDNVLILETRSILLIVTPIKSL